MSENKSTMPPLPVIEGVEFRHCARFPGYAVGSDGSVWSSRWRRTCDTWKRLRPGPKVGYRMVILSCDGRPVGVTIAVLVCEAFHGPRPPGMQVCHYDGSRTNDTPENLRWDTRSANAHDSIRHGTAVQPCLPGETNPSSRLTKEQIITIRSLYPQHTQAQLAKMFGVTPTQIHHIVRRKQWKHVT